MIYAIPSSNDNELIMCGSKKGNANYRDFLEKTDELVNYRTAEFEEVFTDDLLSQFKNAMPVFATFPTEEAKDNYISRHSIKMLDTSDGIFEHNKMMTAFKITQDNRSIREINNLDEHDPWDTRTEEQKQAAKEASVKARKQRDKDKARDTQGSWGDEPTDNKLRVGNIDAHVDDDGNVVIDRIHAVKGTNVLAHHIIVEDADADVYQRIVDNAGIDEDQYEINERGLFVNTHSNGSDNKNLQTVLSGIEHTIETRSANDEEADADEDYIVAEDDMVAIYYRIQVANEALSNIDNILVKSGLRPAFVARDVPKDNLCWLAYVREASAIDNQKVLEDNNIMSEMVAVNRYGERIVAEDADAVVVDTAAEKIEPPAPWNDRAGEYYAMSEDERKAVITPEWFYYHIRSYPAPHHRVIHITPKSYFDKHTKLWEGDLPIEHLLAKAQATITPYTDAPCMYQCKGLDWNPLDFVLGNNLGMASSYEFSGYINGLSDGDQRKLKA